MERLPSRGQGLAGHTVAVTNVELARVLRELIAALDRRVPQARDAAEASIAGDAAALRATAIARLAELGDEAVPAPRNRGS